MTLEEKGMALGKGGMARRHAKRGCGKHYMYMWGEGAYELLVCVCRCK